MTTLLAILLTLLPHQENLEKIRQLVDDLGADDYTVREKATEDLAAAGDAAIPLLKQAAGGDDPEIVRRARMILDLLEWHVPYALYLKRGNIMEDFLKQSPERKRAILDTVRGEKSAAIPILRKVVERDPAMLPHALQYLSEIDPAAAVEIGERELARGNEASDIFRIVYRAAIQKKDYEKALKTAIRAGDRFPDDADFHQSAARAFHELRRFAEAAEIYERMASRRDSNVAKVSLLRYAADEYLAGGVVEAARRCIRTAADDETCGPGEFVMLVQLYRKHRLVDDAVEICESRLKKSNDMPVVNELAALYNETRQFDKTIKLSEQYLPAAAASAPDSRGLLIPTAVALKRTGDRAKAESVIRKTIAGDNPKTDDFLRCAEILKICHLGEETIRCYTDALKRFPQERNLIETAAEFYENGGKYREALETMKALPDAEKVARAKMADLERYNGNEAKAIELWKDATLPEIPSASYPSGLVRTLVFTGRIDEAIAECEKIRKDLPENKAARDTLILLLAGSGRYAEAVAMLPGNDFDEIGPYNPRHLRMLCLEKDRRYAEAVALLRQTLERESTPYHLRRLGNILFLKKEFDEAAQAALRAEKETPGHMNSALLGRIAEARGKNGEALLWNLKAAAYSQSDSVDKKIGYLGKRPGLYASLLADHEKGLRSLGGKALAVLSRIEEGAGKSKEAVATFRQYIEAETADHRDNLLIDDDLALELGHLYERLGMKDEAVAHFESYRKEQPEDVRPLYYLADLARARGDTTKADGLLREAERIGHDDLAPAHYRYLLEHGKPAHARREAEKVVNLLTDDAVYDANALGSLAGIAVDAEEYAAAAANVRRQSFIIEVDNIVVYSETADDVNKAYVRAMTFHYQGMAFEKTGKKSEAEKEFLKAVKTWHPFFPAHMGLARVTAEKATREREIAYVVPRMRFEIETEPLNPENYYELAKFLHETGAPAADARPLAAKAAELEPENKKYRDLLTNIR